MSLERVEVKSERLRCPFCHAGLSVEAEEWVACKQCLARHHRACWAEGGRCSSCQGTAVLQEAPGVPLDDDIRRETSRILEEAARPGPLRGLVKGIFSFGVAPIVGSVEDYRNHRAKNAVELATPVAALAPDVAAKILDARRAAAGSPLFALERARAVVAALLLLAALVALAASLFERDFEPFYVSQLLAILAVLGHQHLHREAVMRHERAQFFAKLVGHAVPPAEAKAIVDRAQGAWTLQRAIDVLLTLGALIPVVGLVFLPLALVRTSRTLAIHEEHERWLPGK